MIEELTVIESGARYTKSIENNIDKRAIVDPRARIGKGVSIGPWSIIGANVEIGDDCWIGPHVVIRGTTKIGDNNKFFQFSSIGEDPQDKKYQGEETQLIVGDNNIFRESCTINRGTAQGGGITKIGNDNLFMAYVHVAHDCVIGNHTIFSNNASLAGHVIVDDYVNFGGFSAVHQYCHIGAYAFLSKAMITKDVLPYVMVSGHEPTVCGLNTVGLRRRGFSNQTVNMLRRAYKIIFRQSLTVQQSIAELELMVPDCQEIQSFIDALQEASRGIVR